MIKAIFFDIDGTLVSFKTHQIPQSTLDAVHRVRQEGVKVFIATGRPIPFVNNLGKLEYDGIMSVSGGSCVTREGEVICRDTIEQEDLQRLIDYHKEHPMPIAFASDDDIFITEMNKTTEEVYKLLDIKNYGQIRSVEACLDMEVMQIIAFFRQEEESYIMKHILPHCDAYRWHPAFIDAVRKGVSKATGVDLMLKHYGIRLDEALVFGDGGNDIAMLDHVPHSVAMGNASDEVKRHARYVTDTVDNDGIAKFLEGIHTLQTNQLTIT